MKTSTKLLLGLFAALVVAMFSAAISLRRQYDRIDRTDKYVYWKKQTLSPFRAVQINGLADVRIEAGQTTRLLIDTLNNQALPPTFRVERDTLYLTFTAQQANPYRRDEYGNRNNAQVVVQCPALITVSTRDAQCQIINFTGEGLALQQSGWSHTTMSGVRYNQLTGRLEGGSGLTIERGVNNRIGQAAITLRDSSSLQQHIDFPNGLTIAASSGTSLHLTGKAIQQIQR